jgi:hypothetical protein
VEAWHRRVRIRCERDEAAAVVDRRELAERVDEAPLGEHPRRCCRHHDIPDEPDQVGHDEPVPEAGESLVMAQIHPQQRRSDHCELREPVGVRRHCDEDRRGVDNTLDGWLEEGSERVLLLQDPLAVLECARDASVGLASHDLVGHVETHPDQELDDQVRPAAGQAPRCLGDEARHDRRILTRRRVGGAD